MIPEAWLQDQEDGEVVWWPPTRKPDDAQMHIAKCTKPGPDWHCFPVVEICPRRLTKEEGEAYVSTAEEGVIILKIQLSFLISNSG